MSNSKEQYFTLSGDIIEACVLGSRTAQRTLYDYFSPKMFGICLRYANDRHHAEDILQEGFIKVFNNLDKYRGEGSFEGWLKRVFINTAIEHCRKSKFWSPNQELKELNLPAIEENAVGKLAKQELLKVIQRLPLGYKTVFNLYAIEGYSHKEIADMLHISEGTSKSQLARAREHLQKMLQQHT